MGASMGGAIALHYTLYTLRSATIRNRPPLAGVILSAPFVALDHHSAPAWITVKAGKLAAKAFPNQQRLSKLDAKYMCRDPKVCEEWTNDSLCHDTGTLAGMAGMLARASDLVSLSQGAYVRSLTNELPCPIWVGHGEGDRVTSCKATQRLYDVLSAPEGDRTMHAFPNAYHMLHKEPEGTGEEFTQEIGEWCLRRVRGEKGALPAETRKSMHLHRSREDALRKSVDVRRTNGNGNGHAQKASVGGGTKL
jgi:acylglycerol lipase